MRTKNANIVLAVLILVLLFAFFKWRNLEYRQQEPINRNADSLSYSTQGLCWMQCQQISREDVTTVLESGIIIYHRNKIFRQSCPVITMRGYDMQKQNIELTLQQCNRKAVLLKAVHLKTNTHCSCL